MVGLSVSGRIVCKCDCESLRILEIVTIICRLHSYMMAHFQRNETVALLINKFVLETKCRYHGIRI